MNASTEQPPRHDVPTAGRTCFATCDGRQIHYLEWGKIGLPTVVLLHGAGQTAYMYEELGAFLGDAYHVYAPDLPDHGDTDPFDDDRWTRFALADAVASWMHHIGINDAALVGSSVGGITAITLAVSHHVQGPIVLIDVAPRMEPGGRERLIEYFSGQQVFATLEEASDVISRELPGGRRPRVEGLRRSLRQRADGQWIWKHGMARRMQSLSRDYHAGQPVDPLLDGLEADVTTIDAPILVLRGARSDLLTESAAQDLVARLRHGELNTIGAAGHMAVNDNPSTTIDLVGDFLRRNPPPSPPLPASGAAP